MESSSNRLGTILGGRRAFGLLLFLFFLLVVGVLLVLTGGDPHATLAVFQAGVLAREVDAFAGGAVLASLRQVASTGRELGGDGGVLGDPVGQGVFAVLDDAGGLLEENHTARAERLTHALLAS